MLTEFSIGNYQAFSTPQRVPIKPITLIFGPNSAGKSALLRSLLVIKHALLRQSMTKGEGSHPLHPGQVCEYARGRGVIPLTLKVLNKADEQDLNERMTFSANLLSQEGGAVCESVEWSRNDLPLLRSKWNKKSKTLVPEFVSDELRPSAEEVSAAQVMTGQAVEDIVKTWLSESDRGLPSEHSFTELASSDLNSPILNTLKDFLADETVTKDAAVLEKVRDAIERISGLERLAGTRARERMHGIAVTFHATICRELQEMAYHEPLRPVPKRIEKSAKDDPALSEWWRLASEDSALRRINDWFASNPHTKRHRLTFDLLLPISNYSGLLAHLGGELSVDQAIESAFVSKLESDAEFADRLCDDYNFTNGVWADDEPDRCSFDSKEEARGATYDYFVNDPVEHGWHHFHELADNEGMEAALGFLMLGVNSLRKDYATKIEAPTKHFAQADIYFEDVATGAKVPPSNLGVGFSQMVPFVSSALSSENRLIVIEQPELHVHPALQTELADLFTQSAKERGNRFLIETHSEHLILRVMKRIRQTFEDKVQEGKPRITPDDVCVLYVEPGENGSIVREMPLNERGELVKGWPGGFFEEALNEMF